MLFNKDELNGFLNDVKLTNQNSSNLQKIAKFEFKEWLDGLSSDLKKALQSGLDPTKKDERVKKAKSSFKDMVSIYFGHHVKFPETSKFRNFFYKHNSTLTKNNHHMVFKAYRGAAKTTLISRLYVLFIKVVKKEKRNTIIVSATLDLSKKTLDFIKDELETNSLFIDDFNITKGEIWSSEEIVFYVGKKPFKISVYGAGKKIRGENWRGFRPDLIICDDLENDENVKTKSQRDKIYNWFEKAIMKLPARDDENYNIFVIGTTLHYDCLLNRLEKRVDFKSFTFPLVLSFPFDLETFALDEFILDDISLNKERFFLEYKASKGAFLSEYQQEPLSSDELSFSSYQTFDEMPLCDAYYMGIDPSLGKSKGDYFSIAILGLLDNKFYAKVKMTKLKPEVMAERIISEAASILSLNRPLKIAIETVQFQEFFKDYLEKRSCELGIYLPIISLKNTVAKELRIDSLTPPINNGVILIDKHSHTFIDELDTYPKSAHDDGLDSLEFAWRIAKVPNFDYEKANKFMSEIRQKKSFLKRIFR
ncbi:phage terminase large subunit [Campylobacter corcagiensis]|uniref:Phage terminase large subunit n=1 Tax=Campylobacter corcagiensis TaxID=1448857 RepID=A0A7M1LF97_9BACT|nr:phage terminase large subunit [Campylobacter corcagiensis]QKF64569.1 terminase domain-containing protein [Campylobacter corcagiensis]QOQ87257.1 phage terminase large subunit [Campylobacter corcagiensis]